MLSLGSKVLVNGLVASIDYDKRDLVVLTKTPMGRDVKCIVHMWKNSRTSNDPTHVGRGIWEENISVGDVLNIVGHMGNNGRIIAVGYQPEDDGYPTDEDLS